MTDQEYLQFLEELQLLEKDGIKFDIDGQRASSVDVVHAHMIRETSTYMRDYIPSSSGKIEEVRFNKVKH